MELQAVIFDFGNVLSLPQQKSALHEMAAEVRLPAETFEKCYWEVRHGYDAGLISGSQYWHELAERAGCKMDEALAARMIDLDNRSWACENSPMSEFARTVKKAGFRTALLSNMPPDFRDYLPVGVKWLPQFDHHTLSCELKVTKPEPKIYEHCIRGLKVEPEAALFIDDRQVNIEAAQALGLRTVLFVSTEQALAESAKLCGVAV